MIYKISKRILLLFMLVSCASPQKQFTLTEFELLRNRDFNDSWKFSADSVPGAEQPGFNDSGWRNVELPHDWTIENNMKPISDQQISIFSKKSPGGASTGHVLGGTAWYRKTFFIGREDKDRIFHLAFDGVYMITDVWVNGIKAGSHYYGYTPFSFNITPLIKANANNVIAVLVRNPGKNSRWYTGSGIYRQVKLHVTQPVYVSDKDVFISTSSISDGKANLSLSLKIMNENQKNVDASVRIMIVDENKKCVYDNTLNQKLNAGTTNLENQSVEIKSPELWSTETPHLYKLSIEVLSGKMIHDIFSRSIGIRTLSWSAEKGLLINGNEVKLKGACFHADNGLLGSATIGRAEERKIELLKKNGFNAVRTSHNPPSKLFLDYCDKLGMLVLEEAFDMWEYPKNPDDYHLYFRENWKSDLESMIYRDRNHPSVIIWSIGNEIYERADTSGIRIAKQLSDAIRILDSTRPLTAGICEFWEKSVNIDWSVSEPAFKYLDIGGYNYQMKHYESDHKKYPKRIIIGTESFALESFDNWKMADTYPWVIGDFIWTGIDYIGESGIGHGTYGEKVNGLLPWPCYNSWCGDIDLTGQKKPQSYYRDVVWKLSKLEMAVLRPIPGRKTEFLSTWGFPDELQSWTWPGHEGETMQVSVYSRCQSVILKLNGKIVGHKKVTEDSKLKVSFDVPYSPGKLEAIGMDNGVETASNVIYTTGIPAMIELKADRDTIMANRNDLSYVTVSTLDKEGRLVINKDLKIKLTVTGDGELIASGNGAMDDMASFRNPEPKTFRGHCLAIVRPFLKPGEIKLTAVADSLPPVSIIIKSK
jgi:beta-galactosidase